MTDESSRPGTEPRGKAPLSRDEEVHRLHRWEASSAADRRGRDIRRHTDVSTSAALDIPTRPDPAAPLTSVAQSGATGRATTSGPGRAVRRRRRGWGNKLLGAVGVAGFLLTWELLPLTGLVNPRFMPPASDAIGGMITNFGLTDFWVAIYDTMRAWAMGMLIAVVLATVLGFIIGSSTFLRRFTNSTIEFMRPVPSVALIPLAVLLFGSASSPH